MNWKIILGEKLISTRQKKGENVVSYLTCIMLVKDELATIGENVDDKDFVRTTLNEF